MILKQWPKVLEKKLLILLAILLVSCESTNTEASSSEILSAEVIEIQKFYEIPLSDEEDFFFGDISDVSATSDGRIVVLDNILKKIHLFSSDGQFISSNLREGRGPGEINRPYAAVRTLGHDKIAFYDEGLQRISVFKIIKKKLHHLRDVNVENPISDFHLMHDNKLVVYEPAPIGEKEPDDKIYSINESGIYEQPPVLTFGRQEQLIVSPIMENINITMGISTNYHTKNLFCFTGNKLYFNHSNKTGYEVYDLETGTKLNRIQIDRPEIPLPLEKREEVIDEILSSSFFQNLDRSRLIREMPDVYPQVRAIKCESDELVWLLITLDEEKSSWIQLSHNGNINGRFDSDFDDTILYISSNTIYTKSEDEKGAAVLRVYQRF